MGEKERKFRATLGEKPTVPDGYEYPKRYPLDITFGKLGEIIGENYPQYTRMIENVMMAPEVLSERIKANRKKKESEKSKSEDGLIRRQMEITKEQKKRINEYLNNPAWPLNQEERSCLAEGLKMLEELEDENYEDIYGEGGASTKIESVTLRIMSVEASPKMSEITKKIQSFIPIEQIVISVRERDEKKTQEEQK